ncbi:MAG: Glu-tRNA(Gln) amidotransferase GatDE subunit E [Alphaproteobacteria bacterium]|nr:Glu-tRNA(Gln) amidotransferase GatDE subunit E [Alphaproteobacteria bacterium]MDA8029711.1 Glu-tRNA(Gln) amidotransferase GatDE subunit E [Alphaproteobacteria bacterium]
MKDKPPMEGALVGLEIHQQLDTGSKLFCRCDPSAPRDYKGTFTRRLQPRKGETGAVDHAALFEAGRGSTFTYHTGPCVCMIEEDEKPPTPPDEKSLDVALRIAAMLGSRPFTEMYVMRKIVVDGSNTSGFQRTMLAACGGHLDVGGRKIGIQTICLEEDAAEPLDRDGNYGLGRLGIPLVEIATEPFDPAHAADAALALGRMLRSTGAVMRGLGTIRQDVNVSLDGGRVIEIKGVQSLGMINDIVSMEVMRQDSLRRISRYIPPPDDPSNGPVTYRRVDAGGILGPVDDGLKYMLVVLPGMARAFKNWNLAGDLNDVGRALGARRACIRASEVFTHAGWEAARRHVGMNPDDYLLVMLGPARGLDRVLEFLLSRLGEIRDGGAPADTRAALEDGTTRFMRPRPGAARMYPETDIPPVTISGSRIAKAAADLPESYDDALTRLTGLGLGRQLAVEVIDEGRAALLEKIAGDDPGFAASAVCSLTRSIARDGGDPGLLDDGSIIKTFRMLHAGRITKEAVGVIFRRIMNGEAASPADAASDLAPLTDVQVAGMVDAAVAGCSAVIEKRGRGALGAVMGLLMRDLRGRVPGDRLNRMATDAIDARMSAGADAGADDGTGSKKGRPGR